MTTEAGSSRTQILKSFDSQHDLGTATLTKFYRDLANVVGSQISVEAPLIEDADEDDD